MRHIVLLCTVPLLLSACVRVDTEERDRPSAWQPTVTYHYETAQQLSEAQEKAAEYCTDRFYAGARPASDQSADGQAAFLCVSN